LGRASLRRFLVTIGPLLALLFGLTLAILAAYQVRPGYSFEMGQSQLDPAVSNFYGPERNSNFAYRWSYPSWELRLPLVGRQDYKLEIQAISLSAAEVRVVAASSGRVVASFKPGAELQTFNLNIPASEVPGNEFYLKFSSPAYRVNGDNRELGVLVTRLRLQGSGSGLLLPPVMAWLGLLGAILPLFLIPTGFLALGGRLSGRWWLALPVLGVGLAASRLAASDRSGFARLILPIAAYLATATVLQYLFLIGPPALAWLLSRSRFKFKPVRLEAKQSSEPQSKLSETETLASIPNLHYPRSKTQYLILVWGLGAVVVYLALRLVKLADLPIFLDEALHISAGRRAQVADFWVLGSPGKALHGWLLAFLFNLSGSGNLLITARLLSVLSGLVTLAAIYLIGRRLFSIQIGLVAAWLWAIVPYAVWHERMALVDPLMTSFTTLALLFSLRLFDLANDRPSKEGYEVGGDIPLIPTFSRGTKIGEKLQARKILGYGGLLGLSLTCAELTKLSGAAAIITPPLVLLLLYPPRQWLTLASRLSVVAPVFFLTTVPLIRLFDGIWGGEDQQTRFAGFELTALTANLGATAGWLFSYLTGPLLGLGLLVLPWSLWRERRRGLLLVLLTLLPLSALVLVSHLFYSRYLLFMLVPLVIAIAALSGQLWHWQALKLPKVIKFGVGLGLALPLLWLNWQMIDEPANAPLPVNDRSQYIEDWPSGYGLEGAARLLRQTARQEARPVVVFVPNAPVIVNDGLLTLLANEPNITIYPVYPPQANLANRLYKGLNQSIAFLVVTRSSNDPNSLTRLDDSSLLEASRAVAPELSLTLIYTSSKPSKHARIEVYRLQNRA